jgi:hypothetical protein
MSKEKKEYDDKIIKDVIKLIDDRDILGHDFIELEEALKGHYYHTKDDADWGEVLEYIQYDLNGWERSDVLKVLGVKEYNEIFDNFEVTTLDDKYKLELLMKLYKESSTTSELENMLKDSTNEKLKYTVL